jgi:hypothetical protein
VKIVTNLFIPATWEVLINFPFLMSSFGDVVNELAI